MTTDGSPAPLTQRDGNTPAGTIPSGTEVMIDAWLPPRDGGTRYFVTSVGTGPQGWLVPEHLRAVVRPPTPKPVVVTPVKPAPVARKRKQAIGTVAAPKVAVAKIAPAKTVPAKVPAVKAKVAATPVKRGA